MLAAMHNGRNVLQLVSKEGGEKGKKAGLYYLCRRVALNGYYGNSQ